MVSPRRKLSKSIFYSTDKCRVLNRGPVSSLLQFLVSQSKSVDHINGFCLHQQMSVRSSLLPVDLNFIRVSFLRVQGRSQPWGFSGSSVVKNLLPIQETQVRFLGREDPTGLGASKPVGHIYWACGLEPRNCNYWSPWALEPVLHNKRSHRDGKSVCCNAVTSACCN